MSDAPHFKETLVLVTGEGLGRSDDRELRLRVFAKYLEVLEANGDLPGAFAFYTDGVRLCVEGSPVLEHLRRIEAKGVHLVLCKTCIDAYGLAEKVRVGVVGGMGDIVAAQALARKVITI